MTCSTSVIFTPVVYLSLYRGKRISCASGVQIDSTTATLIGESVVILSRSSLTLGAPVNIISPFRDRDGLRSAILSLGAQKTSLLHSVTAPVGRKKC